MIRIKRKGFTLIIVLTLMLSLTACGKADNSGKRNEQKGGVSDVLESGVSEEESKNSETSESTKEETTTEKETTETTTEKETTETTTEEETVEDIPKEATVVPPEIDVDLTTLSSTMVYSEVYNMMTAPDSYLGKTVKMSGPFAVYVDDEKGKTYFACIIKDAAACCSQGIEFQLEGDYSYPEDYPAVDDIITVVGTFSVYEEDGYIYATLLDAKMD